MPPSTNGLKPSYAQQSRSRASQGELELLVSPDGRDGSIQIHQDATIRGAMLKADDEITYEIPKGRHAWVQVVEGVIDLDGHELVEGDGAAVSDETHLKITAKAEADLLVFDLK